MKIKKIQMTLLVLILGLIGSVQMSHAQSETITKKEKKVIIVEKRVDENGEVTTEERVLEGEEAEEYMREQDLEKLLEEEIDLKDLEEKIEMENLRVVEIEKEIQEQMKNLEVQLEELNGQYHIRINNNGEEIEWEGAGDIPDDILRQMESMNIEFPGDDEHSVIVIEEDRNDRAVMGVMVENVGGNGAMVTDVFDDSGAEKAGLEKGDIIYKVDGEKVTDVKSLIDALDGKKIGDKVKVKYLRDGKKKSDRVVLGQMRAKEKAFHGAKGCHKMEQMKCHPGATSWKTHPQKEQHSKRIVIVKSDDDGSESEVIVREIPNGETEIHQLNVFPNPGDGAFNVQFQAPAQPTIVRVVTMDGKELYKKELEDFSGSFQEVIDVERLDGGVILQIQQGDNVITETILK